ncbi:MAG TPA: DNA or RNA helicase of superfamily II [Candidatus Tenderia sp.]|nr:DNA or RNA helicase of superfamily II [Candidatus Tenderia sp.]
MSAPTAKPDPRRCPLCGQANQCGATRDDGRGCWCQSLSIPAALLAQLPPETRDKACICRSCIDAFSVQPRQE